MDLFKSKIKKALILLAAVGMTVSCAQVKDIAYFQNRLDNHPEKIDMHTGIVIQPKDMISIVVSSRNPELVPMFNLPVISYQAGSEIVNVGQQRLMGYVVDNDGYIDFPVLGQIQVGGMTRWQLSEMIKERCGGHGGVHELQGISPRRGQPSGYILGRRGQDYCPSGHQPCRRPYDIR